MFHYKVSINTFISAATTIQGRLTQVQTMTDSLKSEGADLDQALTNVKQDLMNDLGNCPSSIQGDCQYIRPSVDTLDTVADFTMVGHIDDLLQDCSNSSALAMELLQSCTKPSTSWWFHDMEMPSSLLCDGKPEMLWLNTLRPGQNGCHFAEFKFL